MPSTEEKRYVVRWTIDIWADTPEQAARTARLIQLDAESEATIFEVLDVEGNILTEVDLLQTERKDLQ